MQLSIIETDWLKVRREEQAYGFYLEELQAAYSANNEEMSKEFISEFEHPVHP